MRIAITKNFLLDEATPHGYDGAPIPANLRRKALSSTRVETS